MRLLLTAALLCCACSDPQAAPDAAPPDLRPWEGLRFPDSRARDGGPIADAMAPDTVVDPNDWDGDGVPNDVEQQLGLNPNNKDTDNDGTDDGQELGDPSSPKDSDGDNKPDAVEPDNFDSDLDGTPDSQDSNDNDGPCGSVQRLFLFATLSQNTTLAKNCSPYKVLGSLTVNSGATLTVDGDVTVRFGPSAALYLGDNATKGGLNLAGSKDSGGVVHPVLLTADSTQPGKGMWRGVVAENGKLVLLSHATVEYGGGATGGSDPRALLLIKAADAITLNASTLQNGVGHGLYATLKNPSGKLFLGFRDSVFSNLDHAAALNIRHLGEIESGNDFGPAGSGGEVRVSEGTVDQPANWKTIGVPYVLLSQSIYVDAPLQLSSGVKLQLQPTSAIYVASGANSTGQISVQGTTSAPVIFTTPGGAAGSWQGILLLGGKNSLQHVRVIGAGQSSSQGVSAALYVDSTSSVIANDVVITNSSGDGAYLYRQGNGCTLVQTDQFNFSGSIAQCGLFCLDDYNSPGQCLKQAP